MGQEFWSDKPLTITISGKSPNNSGIPKIDITGEKGIICGRTITSTTNSLIRTVSNSAAGSSAKSVSTKFYASCQWDNPRRLTTDVNTYGNIPGCGKSTGNIKVKVWWDSVKKGDSSDDTYVEQTISNVTIKNAVETIEITGLSHSNGNPIPFKNGAYALNGYNELDGIYVNYRLKGEYHESNAATSTNLTYMPIYDSTVKVNINNTYFDSYTCVTPGTVEQYTINGKYFIPTKFNKSTSTASTGGSIDGGDIVGPGDTVATPFPSGTFQIMLQALGGHRQPSTAVTLDVVVSSEPDYQGDYLTLSALEDGEITITIPAEINKYNATSISYSKDKSNWTETVVDNTDQTITIPVSNSDNVYLKGVASCWYEASESCGLHIDSSANINVSGNIMSLLYGDDFKDKTTFQTGAAFRQLFMNNTHLINAENLILPATTLEPYCYANMFCNCSSLETAPELPATILAYYCYYSMFYGCTSLTTAPELPATTLNESCYNSMFCNCSSLETAPELPATTLYWDCYNSMFYGCSSLTQAPELPATDFTDLTSYCYFYMFKGCSKLNYVKAMFITDQSLNTYLNHWLEGVSSTGTFVKNAVATWTNKQAGIPTGWTVQTA